MSCTLNTVIEKALELQPKAKKDSLGVYIPFDESLPKKKRFIEARKTALKLVKDLNKEFNAENFSKVASLNATHEKGVGVTIDAPKRLDDAYKVKENEISPKEAIDKNKESKIDFSEEVEIFEDEFEENLDLIDTSNELQEEVNEESPEEYTNDQELSQTNNLAKMHYESKENHSNGLITPSSEQHDNRSTSEPLNFKEWKNIRIETLNELEEMKKRLFKTKRSEERKNKLSKINELIKNIQEELASFDEKDPYVVHDQIVNEINSLNDVLNMPKDDFKELSLTFENNRIRERILKLEEIINDELLDVNSSLYYNLMKGLDENKVNSLRQQVTDLKRNYIKNINSIIKSIIKNQETIQYESENKSERYKEKFDNLIDRLINLEQADTRDSLGETLLSGSMYDSIFADLLSLIRSNNQIVEENRTAPLKEKLKNSFLKIKNIKINGKTIQEIIFAKDQYGVKQNRIITPFSRQYYSKIKRIKTAINSFMTANYLRDEGATQKYKAMQRVLKANVDFIELYKIKSIAEKYKNNEDFKSYFTYSEKEMDEYENEIREKMGDIAFEQSLKKSQEELETFLEDAPLNAKNRQHQNPLNFISHFYSNNFLERDQTTKTFILPQYINFIPKLNKENYYNLEFKEIEKQFKDSNNHQDFKDFYYSLTDSLEYVNEIIPDTKINSVINIAESSIFETIKQLGYFNNIPRNLFKIMKMYFEKYISGNYFKGQFEDRSKNKSRDLNIGYSEYAKSQVSVLKNMYSNKSIDELLDIAKNENLITIDNIDTVRRNIVEDEYQKEALIDSIVTNEINKSSSDDLLKRVNHALNIAESANTRLNTKTIVTFVKDYLKEKGGSKRHSNFIEQWEAQVIDDVGYLDNEEGERNKIQKIERTKVRGVGKKLTEVEKKLKKLLEEEKSINDPTEFTIRDKAGRKVKYVKRGDGYYKITSKNQVEPITKQDMQDRYISYINERLNALGKDMTIGSIIEGIRINISKASLMLSPVTQAINRAAGYMQNNMDASTGLYGYTMKELIEARKLLFLASVTKIEDYSKESWSKLTLPDRKRIQQQRILISFLKNHNLIDNTYNEFTGSNETKERVSNILKNLASDFTSNIAEFHNQAELIVAMMQKEMIEKKNPDGTISNVPFYDPKTKMFPFNPSTMELLPEFRTEKNIENIESNDSPFLKNLILKYKDRRNRLNGAYDKSEKILLDQASTGRAITMMLRWWFANTNNEWGTKNVNLSNMEMNVKGRKLVLAEHLPVLGAHKIFSVGTTLFSGVGIASALGVGSIAGVATGIAASGYVIYKLAKAYKKSSFISKKDWLLSANYAAEVSLRTINALVQFTGKRSKKIDNQINKKIRNASDRLGLSEKDRKLMSASAEQLALSAKIHFTFLLGGLAANALLILMSDADDDDEERFKKLQHIDGKMKFIINTRNILLNDLNQYTSPDAFINVLDSKIFYNTVKRSINYIIDSPKKYDQGIISESEMYSNIVKGVSGPFLGVPNIFYTDKLRFQSSRVYDNTLKTPYDDLLLNYHLSGEPLYERKVEQLRNKARKKLTEIYRKRVRKEFKKRNRKDDIKEIVKKNVDEVISETYKSNYDDLNETVYNEVDFDELVEENEDKILEYDE